MVKYQEIAHLLRHQFERGEYPEGKLPPLRKLAASMGVSYLTARQAVKAFNEAGWGKTRASHPLVVMVTPLWAFTEWHRAIRNQTMELGGSIRVIAYGSDTDPIIADAINQTEYDLIFLFLPDREDSRLLELVSKAKDRAVVMFRDFTRYGIRYMDGPAPHHAEKFMEILKDRGIRRIDAIGRDNDATDIVRHRAWREWLDRNGMEGKYFNIRHLPFEHDDISAATRSRELLAGKELGNAVFCLTTSLAYGLYRACYEYGIVPGRDISIFSFGEPERARMMTPPLATVENIDIAGTVRQVILEYCPGAEKSDRLTFRLDNAGIFLGESLIK